jgi:hypothetical protein
LENGHPVALFLRHEANHRGPASKRPWTERRAFILGLLEEQPYVTNPSIAIAALVSESIVRRWTGRMVREGDLNVEKYGGSRPATYTRKDNDDNSID